MEQAAYSKYVQWKERHPILAKIFTTVIIAYIIGIMIDLSSSWIQGKISKLANVYEEPTASSVVVVKIEEHGDVMIIDSVPYYYQVYFIDPETGEEKWGYISKKNVCPEPIETSNESD